MITTRRSTNGFNDSYYTCERNASVGLLERENEEINTVTNDEMEEARARMHRNLDMLLNGDKISDNSTQGIENVKESVEEAVVLDQASAENEDIRPSSTTMQFGDGDIDKIYSDANRGHNTQATSTYHLNTKGKVAILLYSLAIAVILTLIVLNTGVLSVLKSTNTAKAQELTALEQEYTDLQSEIQEISSESHIINIAENEYGMIKGE